MASPAIEYDRSTHWLQVKCTDIENWQYILKITGAVRESTGTRHVSTHLYAFFMLKTNMTKFEFWKILIVHTDAWVEKVKSAKVFKSSHNAFLQFFIFMCVEAISSNMNHYGTFRLPSLCIRWCLLMLVFCLAIPTLHAQISATRIAVVMD